MILYSLVTEYENNSFIIFAKLSPFIPSVYHSIFILITYLLTYSVTFLHPAAQSRLKITNRFFAALTLVVLRTSIIVFFILGLNVPLLQTPGLLLLNLSHSLTG